jgi:hypothetical protein
LPGQVNVLPALLILAWVFLASSLARSAPNRPVRPGRAIRRRDRAAGGTGLAGRRHRDGMAAPPPGGCTSTSPDRTSAPATCPPATSTSCPKAATSWPSPPRSAAPLRARHSSRPARRARLARRRPRPAAVP